MSATKTRASKRSKARRNVVRHRVAIEGETFAYRRHFSGETFEVKTKKPGERGQWVCISCGIPLANQFEKDTHMDLRPSLNRMLLVEKGPRAHHVFAWRNFETGDTEVP